MMNNKLIFALSLVILAIFGQQTAQAQKPDNVNQAGPVSPWPAKIPARISDPTGNLFIMTLGEIKTPVAQGTYDPVNDWMILNDGTVIEHYYRDSLHVKYYSPIDKSIYPIPPSGFCTWYYYYQDINQDEVILNTDWVAKNLIQYGARYVQIDDGWQKETQDGRHGSRDWTGFDTAFSRGMADMAKYIRSKGLVPGIWIAPHGQSNEKVVKENPGVFILNTDGSSASKTWEGDWLLDPTSPQAKEYFYRLFDMMVKWGYDYYKIDGQPIVVEEYAKNSQKMYIKGGAADSLYRTTLDIIRKAIGPNRYLLGCWGLPIEGAGIMNGSRTGGDVVLGWDGFKSALSPTMESYYQHNILWYTDPDVMLLRQPFTIDQARVWATLQGLTGQALMSSDRLPDLSAERVKILHRVFPATDIRPLDLFPSFTNKKIWDLKIKHLNRQYDVVGLFNFEEDKSVETALKWRDIGIQEESVHVFDFWNDEFMGTWDSGISLSINPTSCRVLTLLPDNGEIQLISTSRHITQGWVDLVRLDSQSKGSKISGTSHIPAGEPYVISFAFPRGKNFSISSSQAFIGKKRIPVKAVCHQGWATIEFSVEELTNVDWSVNFEPAGSFSYSVRQPEGIEVTSAGIDAVKISWQSQYYLNAGYQVYLDSILQGYTPGNSFIFRGLDPSRSYNATVRSAWSDGTVNAMPSGDRRRNYNITFKSSSLVPSSMYLSDIGYEGTPVWFTWPVSACGKRYVNSLEMTEGSARTYEIKGLFTTFSTSVCVDDSAHGDDPSKAIEFIVRADGTEIWRSAPMKKGDRPVECVLPVSGVQKLTLSVKGGSTDFWEGLPGDWIEAKVVK